MADLSSSSPELSTSNKDFKKDLLAKIKQLAGLTDAERAELVKLLNDTKKYGLIWEDKPEAAEELLRTKLPVFREVVERRILSESEFSELENDQNKRAIPKTIGLFDELNITENHENQINQLNHGSDIVPPNHILIEGDNLHALTALSFTHEGKIDVIYIDPPYNTGNKDFKYNDTFVDKEDSYRHSKWLSFMHKRLKIAKRLLSEKGVIFISIDDNENAQLKLLCDDIFSETNFISDVIWQARKSVSNDTIVSLNHNYTLIYAKEISKISKKDFRLPTISEKFNNPDNDSRGSWIADPFDAPNLRPNLTYAIVNPNNGKIFWPPKGRCWRTSEDEYLKFLADNRIVFGKKGKTKPQLKRFLDFAQDKGSTPISIWYDIETTTNGTQQLEQILGSKLFTNPKPLGLIDRILKLSSKNNTPYIILDFFAGSGTTLHATMQLNAEDGGNRQCILVTNNENDICEEVTYERNRRVIQGYTNAKGEWVKGLTNNNLRYYQVDFVDSAKTEVNRRKLTVLSTNLLQIKEECYLDITEAEGFDCSKCSIHTNEHGKYMVVIYHSRTQIETTELLSNWIASRTDLSEKVKIYAFGHETEIIVDDFYAVANKIDAVPLPDAIYNAYRATFRTLKLDKKAPVSFLEPQALIENE